MNYRIDWKYDLRMVQTVIFMKWISVERSVNRIDYLKGFIYVLLILEQSCFWTNSFENDISAWHPNFVEKSEGKCLLRTIFEKKNLQKIEQNLRTSLSTVHT